MNQRGFSLIQLVIAMGLVSVGLLIALQASQFQINATKRLLAEGGKALGATTGIKDISQRLQFATNISVSEKSVSYTKYQILNNNFTSNTFTYQITDECAKECLTLKKNGVTIRLFPRIKDVQFCYISTHDKCDDIKQLFPDDMNLNTKRISIKMNYYDDNTNGDLIVINLQNIKNNDTARDDLYFIEG